MKILNKLLTILLSFIISINLFSNFTVFAAEQNINDFNTSTLHIDQYTLTISENNLIRKVITYDSNLKEEYVAIYDKEKNILTDENGNYIGCGYVITPCVVNGPFRTFFDVNPTSAGAIIGAILAVSAFVSAAAVAGIGVEALKQGLSRFFTVAGNSSLIGQFYSGASVNGYFEYSQENNFQAGKARNLNRSIAVRIGYSRGYSTHSYGNGGWFDTRKP
jgi:hypothetical protein